MNLLLDRCPDMVEINGELYPIRSDFRTSILFELMMSDPKLNESQKILGALNLYYERLPEDIQSMPSALKTAISFYNLGKEINKKDSSNSDESSELKRKFYSFEHDSEYIYTSFLTAYGIDLAEVDLHWWKFRTLFNNLPEDTIMKKVIEVRTCKITSKMSKEEKKRLRKLKKIYELPQDQEVKEQEFNDSLNSMF